MTMSVALVCVEDPARVGGVEAVMATLAAALEHHHEVAGVRVASRHELGPWVGDVDVVHVHGAQPWLLVDWLRARRGTPWVATLHGGSVRPPDHERTRSRRMARRAYVRHGLGPLLRTAGAVTAIAPAEARHMVDDLAIDPARVHYVANPVPEDALVPVSAAPASSGRFVVVGRLSAQKRLGDLVAALAAAPDLPGVDILGPDGDDAAAVRAAARALPGGRVCFVGPVRGAERLVWIRRAVALVQCSSWEGMSITALEGLAQHTPLVLSDASAAGLPGGGQQRYPVGDVGALVRCLRSVAAADRRAELAAEAAAAAGALVTPRRYADRLVEIYRALPRPGASGLEHPGAADPYTRS